MTWDTIPNEFLRSECNQFQNREDSLLLYSGCFEVQFVFISKDEGLTWNEMGSIPKFPEPQPIEPEPGYRLRINQGQLEESAFGGSTPWSLVDLDLSFDSPKELATGFGYTFLNLSHILLCRKSRTEKWHVADFVVKKPYWIQEVAASGQKICVTNDTSLWCSRDLGQHFEYMGNRNDSFGGQSSLHTIGMDSNNLYLVNSHRLWQKNLSGIQPWHPLSGNVSAGYQFTSFSINDELLAIPEDRPGPFIHVSSDGGQNFVHISPMNYPGSPDWPRSIVVNSKYWAFSDWFGIYITKDFGTHWTRIDGAMFGIPVFGNHSDFYYRNKSNSKCRYSLVDQKIYTMDDTHIISGVTDSLLFSINQGKLEYSQLEPINPVEAQSQKFRTHNFSRTKNPTEKIFYKNQFIRNALGKKLPN